jgi:hypothetical protein
VIPPRANRSSLRDYDRPLYGERHLVENFFAKIKQFRAIATRVACPRAGEAGPVGEDRAQLPGRRPTCRQRRLAQLTTGPSEINCTCFESDPSAINCTEAWLAPDFRRPHC